MFGESNEWRVDKITRHHGKGTTNNFEILWKTGDKSWFRYDEIKHLAALEQYFELLDVNDINKLPMHSVDEDLPLEISVNSLKIIKVDEYELPEFSSNYSPSLASKFLSTLLLFKMVRPELAIQPLTSTQTTYLHSNYPR